MKAGKLNTGIERIPAAAYFVASLLLYNLLIVFPLSKFSGNIGGNFIDFIYFLSYRVEFMKRGLPGTLCELLHIPLTDRALGICYLLGCNGFFLLMYNYLQHALKDHRQAIFRLVFAGFVIAPCTAWDLGYDFLRTDVFLLFIEVLIVLILIKHKRQLYGLIPVLIALALLTHEAFLFLNLPVIAWVLIQGYLGKSVPRSLLVFTVLSVFTVLFFLFTYGKVSPEHLILIYRHVYHAALPADVFREPYPIWVICSSFATNIAFTLNDYKTVEFWKNFLLISPYLAASGYVYFKACAVRELSVLHKLAWFSPFLSFPMFLIGVDTYRWVSITLINMLIVWALLLSQRAIVLPVIKGKMKFAVIVLLVFSLGGPMGGRGTLPYFRDAVRKMILHRSD